jgi:hypothetical protein
MSLDAFDRIAYARKVDPLIPRVQEAKVGDQGALGEIDKSFIVNTLCRVA